MIEVETQTTEVEVINNVEVTSTSQVEVETVDLSDLDITVAKKEYVITGDDIYIPMLYDDAPQWMKDLVQVVVDVSISSGNQSLINNMNAILQDFAVSYVPLNQYTQSILDLGDEDTRLNGLIETLNSNFNDGLSTANAQITSLQLTKASKDEVVAQVIQTIAAQLADGASNIGSTIGRIDQAIADETSARATSFQVLTSSLEDTNLDVTANATATHALNTYVGLELGAPNGTGLLADVEILQKQNDGVIETTTGTYDVMISPENPDLAQLVVTAEPYVTWKASDVTGIDTRLAHIGDVYVKYADTPNGAKEYVASYKFIRTVVDSTSPYATDTDGFTWALIVDQAAQDAYEQALNAYDLADNKRRVFVNTPYTPYDIGDLWSVQSGATIIGTTQGGRTIQSGDLLRCIEDKSTSSSYEHNDWVPADNYRESMNAIQTDLNSWRTGTYAPFVTSIQTQVDVKAESYYQETMPHIEGTNSSYVVWIGDLWKKPSTNDEYIYQLVGSTYKWVKTDVPDIVYDTIDGKKAIYVGNSLPAPITPVTVSINDMWITGDNPVSGYSAKTIYVWDGNSWEIPVKYTDDQYAKDIENGTRKINLSEHIDDLGWNTRLSSVENSVTDINLDLSSNTLAISNLDNKIDIEEQARMNAIMVEEQARITAIQARVLEDARLDGVITAEEQARINAIDDVSVAYKEYNRLVTLAIADGVLTPAEQLLINSSIVAVNLAKQRLLDILDDAKEYSDTKLGIFIGQYNSDLIATQVKLDGKITSYFQDTDPFTGRTNMSVAEDGDLWYNKISKLLNVYDYTNPTHNTSYWKRVEDQAAIDAANAAANAQSTADGKIVTFVSDSAPVADGLGDIWIDTNDSNHMYRWNLTQWVSVRDTKNDNILANALTDIATLEETNDGVVNSFYQTTAPISGISYGDWWVDTDSSPIKAYRYEDINGKNVGVLSWIDNSTHILGKSYISAIGAQSTADGKIKTFYQNGIPVSEGMGDLWIDLDDNNKTYRAAIKGANEIKAGEWEQVTDESVLDNFLTVTYAKDLLNIGNQLDGVAVTYFQSTQPYSALSGLVSNAGDVWFNTSTNLAYKFVYKTLASDGVTITTPSVWEQITNAIIVNALLSASKTKAAADRSIRNYTVQPTIPYYVGDTWMQGSSGDIYVCSIERLTGSFVVGDWVIASGYTDDTAVVALSNGLANGTVTLNLSSATIDGSVSLSSYVSAEIDSKVAIYSGESAPVAGLPVGVATNDIYLWFTTASKVLANGTTQVYDITRTYKYSGSVWNEITTDSNITALADLADGKRTVFSGNTVPVGAVNRDVWIPSATNGVYIKGEIYQYSGTSWIIATKYSADIESVRGNLQSQIDGKVDTYYQGTVPTGMTALNNGDYWYCTADVSTYKKGKVYKYAHATISWVETADVSRYAFDTADGKASIFISTAQPNAYKINDMLIVTGSFNNGTTTFSDGVVLSSNATRTTGFVAADWVKKINDTEDLDLFVSSVYNPAVLGLQNQIDGKIENWFTLSANDPKVSWVDADTKLKHNGDLWYQTDTKISYYYTSSTHTWNILDDAKAIQALANAATAQTAANNAQTSANTANSLLADIASDSKFTPSEKSLVKKEWDSIQSEYTKNLAQGTSYSVSTAAYTTAYNALNTYITPLLASLTTTSDIVGTTFRATFKSYYDANVDLLNAISNKINLIADGKITSYYMATFSAVQAMSTAWTVGEKTSNIGDLAVVWNDTTLDNNGTWRWNGTSWVTTRDKKLIALASEVTTLSTELDNGTNTWASADSTLENSLLTEITDEGARVESKFAYNSLLNINGIYKKSGFGLTTNYISGSGTQIDPYVSEFWIDASRFKFTNSNITGSVAPFTIDASGANPQIKFNGVVNFSNITNTTGTGSNLLYNSAPKIGSETKGWYVRTNSGMTVNLSAGFDIWKPTGGASVAANMGGSSPSIGSVFDVGQSSSFPVIAGSRYEASAYISAHRTNSYVFVVFYDAAGNYAGEASGNVINYAGSSALVNWGRSSVFTTAPSNAATARFTIRSSVTGADPYCFVAYAFTGVAGANQTTPSNWSEGTSAGATYTSELSNDAGFVLPAGVANAVNTNTTTIHGSKITTGSIAAAQIQAGGITADRLMAGTNGSTVWTGGGLISQNFNGNPYGNIGSPSAGFRLSSGAAGTSTDPNIYGAYIQGSSVEVNSFKVRAEGYASNFGRLNLVSGDTAIVGRGYSTGFDARRVCSDSVSSIKLDCWARATGNWISAVLEYESNSNGSWIVIADRGMSMYGYSEYAYLNFAEFFNPSLVPTTGYVNFRIRLTSGNSGSTSGVVVTLSNG